MKLAAVCVAIFWGCLLLAISSCAADAPPANAAGVLRWSVARSDGHDVAVKLTLKQAGEKITGTFHGEGPDSEIFDGTVHGTQIDFSTHREISSRKVTLIFTGAIDGDTIKGRMTAQVGFNERKSSWTAKRDADK